MTFAAGQPKVSVVMIFLNAEKFLDEAVRSVLTQSYEGVELLLCDDGSTDESTAMALAWQRRHSDKVRYLAHPGHTHRGMSATRNLGIAGADGELLAFLDSDDVWLPDHLQHEVECLLGHPEAAAVCGRALDWHSWDGSGRADVWSPLPCPSGTVLRPPAMLTAVLRQGGYSTPVCSLLVRRDVVMALGGSDDSFTSMYEDQVLLAKLYLTQSVVVSGARTALYRQHAGSSTAEAIRRGLYHPMARNRSSEAYLRWLQQQPQLHGANGDPDLAAALREALLPYQSITWRVSVRVRTTAVGRTAVMIWRAFANRGRRLRCRLSRLRGWASEVQPAAIVVLLRTRRRGAGRREADSERAGVPNDKRRFPAP